MALRRLRKELEEVSQYGVGDVKTIGPIGDNLLEWRAKFYGPEDSPYEGGIFSVDIKFPISYPLEAPTIKFRTCVYHPSVCKSTGKLCSEILSECWKPNKNVKYVMTTLSEILSNPSSTSPLNLEIAREFERNRKKYNKTAKEWTKMYAR